MWISKRALVTMLAVMTGALSLALATGAFGSPGKNHSSHPSHPSHQGRRTGAPLIHESLAPSHPGDPGFHGVMPGGKPWVLKSGNVRLKRDGELDLRVKGLVITTTGTARPVTMISASLYCGDPSTTGAADTTQPVPISIKGDARIHARHFTVPPTCLAPVILVHPVGAPSVNPATTYIAVDGWR